MYERLSLQVFAALLALCVRARRRIGRVFVDPTASGVNETSGLPIGVRPQKNLLWKTPLPPGHSSPILVGDRIFVTAYEGDKLLTFSPRPHDGQDSVAPRIAARPQ